MKIMEENNVEERIVELPLVSPMYSTYHTGIYSAVLANNLSIRNWYLNDMVILTCDRVFLHGFTTPLITVVGDENPYLEKHPISMRFLRENVHTIIRNMLDDGYYVYFFGVDDYYVEGKSWYKERHLSHDGAICGYNEKEKTYCIYAYDKNWIYQKFWTPQSAFEEGRKACFAQGNIGSIIALKPKSDVVEFSPDTACRHIAEHLDSDLVRFPVTESGHVYGIVVHDYIAMYVGKLYDGSIPYERMDRRVFRLIWEHKKVMLERIKRIEECWLWDTSLSSKYVQVVNDANAIRMLYAMHHKRRRDSILPIVQQKLLALKEEEYKVLNELIERWKLRQKSEV